MVTPIFLLAARVTHIVGILKEGMCTLESGFCVLYPFHCLTKALKSEQRSSQKSCLLEEVATASLRTVFFCVQFRQQP